MSAGGHVTRRKSAGIDARAWRVREPQERAGSERDERPPVMNDLACGIVVISRRVEMRFNMRPPLAR